MEWYQALIAINTVMLPPVYFIISMLVNDVKQLRDNQIIIKGSVGRIEGALNLPLQEIE